MRPLGVLLVLSAASWSADLKKIERRVAKAPRYSAATQYHALLVLGDDASYRVWLVIDGDTLYVDRNGDGDLNGAGERIQGLRSSVKPGLIRETRTWKVASLGKAGRYTNVEVNFRVVNPKYEFDPKWPQIEFLRARMKAIRSGTHPNWTKVELKIGGKRRQFCSIRFTTVASTAPIVHMDGPLTLGIVCSLMDFQFGLGSQLKVAVGTPGLGTGTFSYMRYDELPKEARPFAIVTFPGLSPKRYDIKGKC